MTGIDRRTFVAGAAALTARAAQAAPFAWQNVAAPDAGFDAGLEARLDKLIAEKRVWNLHGVFVARAGRVVLERYFDGEENNWGKVSNVRFGPDTLHNLYSVTKSVVALVYGVALAAGKVPSPDAPLYAQFPEYSDLLAQDSRRAERTVGHALTMTLGLQWDEINIPYGDPKNDEIGMEMAKDRYRFILDRPVVGPPSKRWLYSGGATALLGRLIAKGTGMSLPDYAREALFAPLGLRPIEWLSSNDTWVAAKYGTGDGEPVAASGLRMRPRDLARIGQLVLDDGKVDGRQVVSSSWLAQCLMPRVSCDEMRRYGYQWYLGDMEFRDAKGDVRLEHWVGCFGNGGQRLFVWPELDLVVVVTAGNYSAPNQWQPPIRVVREAVLPSLIY
ncbi:MAG: serine hydrolase [Proteobacteria bacterium]|nr:serine hydrolase [Pseudomonadota bacterium]